MDILDASGGPAWIVAALAERSAGGPLAVFQAREGNASGGVIGPHLMPLT